MLYHAVTERDGDWWIGWLTDLEGVNAQERTLDELLESLRQAAEDLLEIRGADPSTVDIAIDTAHWAKTPARADITP